MPTEKRKNWIDFARALAMIFVVYGHVGNELGAAGVASDTVYGWILTVINPLKLPLFFTISGYLFSARNDDTRYFARKMLKTRLLPYAVWGSFMGIVAFGMDFAKAHFALKTAPGLLAENYLLPFVKGNLIWFIPCLIVLEILFAAVLKITRKNPIALIIVTAALTAAGYFWSADGVVKFWKIDTALVSLQFMCFGYLLRRYVDPALEKFDNRLKAAVGCAALAAAFAGAFAVWGGCDVDMNMGGYFNPIGFTVLSMIGVYAVFSLSKLVGNVRPMIFVGQNTFIYFVFHMYVAKVFLALFGKVPGALTMPRCLSAVIVSAVACGAVAPVSMFVNRYLYFTVGKQPPKSAK